MGIELNKIPLVDIDSNGVFKYILIKVHGPEVNGVEPNITIVRGYQRATWHNDIFEEVQSKLAPLDCECIGGGRINHDEAAKKLHVYGYSQGYGKADHEITAQLLKQFYKDYTTSLHEKMSESGQGENVEMYFPPATQHKHCDGELVILWHYL